jgi:AraC-like DNA-binding protein
VAGAGIVPSGAAGPFRQAGLDPARLQDPNARYPFANIQRLWRLATEASGDPCFGLRVAGLCHPTTFHALGYAWMASSTLREAMQRLIRYQIEQLPSVQASEESVAAAPHLSPRMLQCKLREEGTGFKQILEDMRRQLAMQYVQNSQISLNEIT